ncbi:MAG: sigma-70 family RNA polymerase sigma factor [Chitinophagaceae bacterium]|nr:MAG: sigma-70 family RNA polymerase sigma factor [Chitinophagaceae bacterium]
MLPATSHTPSDRELIDRVLKQDPQAFRLVIRQSERMVAQVVHKMVDDEEDRRDMAQEIYLKVYRKLGSFRFESKLTTWICQLAYSSCIDYLRKKKIRPVVSGLSGRENEYGESNTPGIDIATADPGPDEQLARKQMTGRLKDGIAALPPVYRTVITLFHNEEMSYAEIMEITGLPAGTIKSYLARARKTLRENLFPNQLKKE